MHCIWVPARLLAPNLAECTLRRVGRWGNQSVVQKDIDQLTLKLDTLGSEGDGGAAQGADRLVIDPSTATNQTEKRDGYFSGELSGVISSGV